MHPRAHIPSMHVEVLANPECPHCVHILDEVADMAAHEGVPVAGVDVRHHPEAAHGFEHSPVVLYGRRFVLGMPTLDEFRRLVGHG
jgi:glutaredoxin